MLNTNNKPCKENKIEWLGHIPSNWKIDRLGNYCKENKVKNKGLLNKNRLSLSYGKIIRREFDTSIGLIPKTFETYQIVEKNFIVLRLTDLQNDKRSLRVGFVSEKGIITSAYIALKIKNVLPKYLYYLLHNYDVKKVFYLYGGSIRQSMKYDDLKVLPITLPSYPEQVKIVTFLDKKIRLIDKKIKLMKRKIKKYEDLRKSLINETIKKGLSKNIKLQDSGIEWLGKIPEHWNIERLKNVGRISTSSVNKKINDNEKLVKIVNYTDVYNNRKKELYNSPNYMVVSANSQQVKEKKLIEGDVLFTPSSETINDIGVSAVIMEDLKNTLYSYHLVRVRFSQKIDNNFKKYLFNNIFVQFYFSRLAKGTTRQILGLSIFHNLLFFIPPESEQKEIADFLNVKTKKIDRLICNLKKHIELYQELIKTLIDDAVIGKFKTG